MSFEDSEAPNFGPDLVTEIQRRCPHACLVLFRNKNQNVVVYETRRDDKGSLLEPPIVGYWLLIDPEYRKQRRERGIMHDREEFTYFEHNFAYGFHQKRLSAKEANFSFYAFPCDIRVKVFEHSSKMFSEKEGRKYILRQIYIESTEHLHFLRLEDNIQKITCQGIDITEQPYRPCTITLKG